MPGNVFTVHSSLLFDPKTKSFNKNESICVDYESGAIVDVYVRSDADDDALELRDGDIDLRGKVVMPGLVDSHTHIFLYSYKSVENPHLPSVARPAHARAR